jgi:aldose 1-epimerase
VNLVRLTDSQGAIEVELLPEVGARLHRLRVFGHDLLRTPAEVSAHAREPVFWGSYVMAPWCNRVEAGTRVRVGSRRISVPSNFPDGTAIHGQVFARPWEADGDGSFVISGGGGGWPWTYNVRQQLVLNAGAISLDHALTNRSDEPMPAGLGIHPWFRRPLEVAIHAERVHPANVAPEPWPVPVSGPFDLRELRNMPPELDATWTDLAEPPVELSWPVAGIRATMHVDAPSRYIVAASPGDVDAVAVEPQTHAPQGLHRLLNGEPGGLVMLSPGESLGLTVTLAFELTEPRWG